MLTGSIKLIKDLSLHEKEIMFGIMSMHYDNIRRDVFFDDLNEKEGTLLVYDEKSRIRGFSTYLYVNIKIDDENITILFSGDTIVSKECWGSLSQLKIFVKLLERSLEKSGGKIYWLLNTKGFRTYLIMPLFFKIFYPCHDRITPDFEKKVIRSFAENRYAGMLIENDEVMRLCPKKDFLKNEYLDIPKKREHDPNVRYFIDKNPNYRTGEELICIAEISKNNLSGICRKFLNL